jgi:glycosyltransferase involved in cell wall biosynthesis
LLAEPGDPQDLMRQVRQLRDDPALRSRLGRAGREEAFRRHGWEDRVRLVLESYAR